MHRTPHWLWLILWLLPSAANGQAGFTLTADQLQNGQAVELDKLGWKYSPHDEPQFAEPQFDDRAWETLNGTAITLDRIPNSGWHGIGWFRVRLKVDPALANQPLALVMVHYGASEIYLNGKLVERFGTVGTTPEAEVEYNPNSQPFDIVLDERSEHVIAVRYSCMAMRDLSGWRGRWLADMFRGTGFDISVTRLRQAFADHIAFRTEVAYDLLRVGLFLAIGVLYLLLYGFFPQQRASLFFGLYACSVAAGTAIVVFYYVGHPSIAEWGFWGTMNGFIVILGRGLLLPFMYAIFSLRVPKWFWLWLVVAVLYAVATLLVFPSPRNLAKFYFGLPVSIFPVVEMGRVAILAIRKKIPGAWIVGGGVFLFTVFGLLTNFIVITPTATMRNAVSLLLIITLAIYLAKQFARTSYDLKEQLVQVKQLSAAALEHEKVKAEHDRKAKELEEARQLQLSMLPKKLPNLPHLDLAAHMQTASEVGGDYYDFHLGDDGTLTVAVGDATGHGLKAGTMVAAVKSLFVTLAYHPDLPHIFTRMSQTLKQMQMRGVFMALALVKCDERRVNVAIAGMPPLLVYRQATNTVERINLTGLPLGSVTNYRYREMTTEMEPGDVLLLLSDGLTELFNPADEMFGEERVEQCLQACAQCAPDEIIAQLLAAAEAWSEGRKLEDDLTLVALKAK
ncbi:MAG: SpoIIE family protein phosphatase [Acidobacteria bacterium]|nr:SpoIIE family protein phosphatase [Acidobacteriota bacterium]